MKVFRICKKTADIIEIDIEDTDRPENKDNLVYAFRPDYFQATLYARELIGELISDHESEIKTLIKKREYYKTVSFYHAYGSPQGR